jgi:hypothetical protein
MHTALAFLAHALRMLIFETGTTVRVVMPAMIMIMGSAVMAIVLAPDAIAAFQSAPEQMAAAAPAGIIWLLVFGIIGLLGYALMAILWHRHVLLNGAEDPAALMPGGSVFMHYVGRAVTVVCVQVLAGIPITLGMGLLSLVLVPLLGGLALFVIGVLGGLVFLWVALRISLVLPSAALAKPMTVRESWEATVSMSSTIWSISLLLAGLNMGLMMLTSALAPDQGGLALIVQTVFYIIEGLVFVSVLTTLYGHLIEGRSLG